jgi:hypothetical protein
VRLTTSNWTGSDHPNLYPAGDTPSGGDRAPERRFVRGMMVTLGALIRLADRARRMFSFLLSYRAAPATKAATI